MKRTWHWLLFGALGLAWAVALVSCATQAPPRRRHVAERVELPEAKVVGTKKCALCHEAQVASMEGNRHWLENDPRTPLAHDGCESCHGPGSAHLLAQIEDEEEEDGGGIEEPTEGASAWKPTLVSFDPRRPFPAEQLDAQCLTCHQRDRTHWQSSEHKANGVSCVDCHTIHGHAEGKQLKKSSQLEMCGSCHVEQRAAMERTSHHPVREGKMDCTSCHDPHGTGRDSNLVAHSANELCSTCHNEKRGPHLWEHPPVLEDCSTCHEPHGSIHDKLLTANQPYLCQRCHSDARHPGTLYSQRETLTGITPSNRMFLTGCTNCHSRIHGSNHPSGETFLR